ncbi:MAG: regulatory iron-sulfur-containing complex subunit RicT [Bacilli bacterium]|jgi:cell fate regulator YaaT (PSP1 superfamily)|nr:regulatory iron-sulfur-containing complex subunit RicT [Bacilli bacterium]
MPNNNQDYEKNKEEETGKVFSDGFIVSVAFLGNTKPYYFHTYDENLKEGDVVVVETVHGVELGSVVKASKPVSEFKQGIFLKEIMRKATDDDKKRNEDNIIKAQEALAETKQAVHDLKLEMRLLKAEYTLDGAKLSIVYAADNRVDFRELLKVLASKFHCRIDLRQIGSRDRSKIIGGLGICGLPLCCNVFLGEFEGISINIAKNQFLVLNIQKLSGQCGKLLCCLKYEDDQYSELKQGLPKIGQRVVYDGSQYKIGSINVLSREARLESKEDIKVISLDDLIKLEQVPFQRGPKKEEQ